MKRFDTWQIDKEIDELREAARANSGSDTRQRLAFKKALERARKVIASRDLSPKVRAAHNKAIDDLERGKGDTSAAPSVSRPGHGSSKKAILDDIFASRRPSIVPDK